MIIAKGSAPYKARPARVGRRLAHIGAAVFESRAFANRRGHADMVGGYSLAPYEALATCIRSVRATSRLPTGVGRGVVARRLRAYVRRHANMIIGEGFAPDEAPAAGV
jgi:hypothetical protein